MYALLFHFFLGGGGGGSGLVFFRSDLPVVFLASVSAQPAGFVPVFTARE